MSGQFDFLVIGDGEAALCAAAAAAKAGALVAMLSLRPQKKNAVAPATASVPNFVWRRLDLQDYDLVLEPVSARVTLFADGEPIITGPNPRQTSDALGEKEIYGHEIWAEFVEEARALNDAGFMVSSAFGAGPADTRAFAKMLSSPRAVERAARLFGPCVDFVSDYFNDEKLKAHVSAHALAPAGAGDYEAGSAAALAEFVEEDSWRVRAGGDAKSLRAVLERVCQDAGVKVFSGRVTNISSESGKQVSITLGSDETIKVRRIFFATPDEAMIAGALNTGAALRTTEHHALFAVRIKLSEPIDPPTDDKKAIFQIVDVGDDLQEARDAALSGRMHERAPVEFEFTEDGEILARTSYLPSAFYEDGAWRGWSGQDKQAAATVVKDRLISRMPGLARLIRSVESEVATPFAGQSSFDHCKEVVVQRRRHNAISAAVKLIDEVMSDE